MVKNLAVNIGAERARFENQTRIEGTGADVKMYSLTVAEESQEFDQRTFQTHNAGNAVSDLLYKNALLDKSRTIFSGLIKVAEGAQQTDAYQTNRNLLLDPTAEANALPGLEILANDVKCSHGATTGNVDRRELFYMMQRGIAKRDAMKLMVFGFFEEVIEQGRQRRTRRQPARTHPQQIRIENSLKSPELVELVILIGATAFSKLISSYHYKSCPTTNVTLTREVEVTLIPQGTPMSLPEGETSDHHAPPRRQLHRHDAQRHVPHQRASTPMPRRRSHPSDQDVAAESHDGPLETEAQWEALKSVFDPEIPVNIVDLGLVYSLETNDAQKAATKSTCR